MLLYRYTMAGLERVEFITSQKGGQQVFYAGFRYRLNVRRQSATHWKCVVSGCNGRLSTVDDYMKSVSVQSSSDRRSGYGTIIEHPQDSCSE